MVSDTHEYDPKLFKGPVRPNWCPKCGDYALLSATTKALAKLGYQPHEVVIVSGIGCSSSFPHWTTAYGIHMLHGRALPAALGVKLSNPSLKVVVVGGDGDGYGIGAGHFIHSARRNLDVTYMVMNNQIYGLTLGQSSPSSQMGHITLTTPEGVDERPINPLALALGAGAAFVARGFSGESSHLQSLVEDALQFKGFSFIDVLSPCVTFNKLNTYEWFRERIYKLEDEFDYSSDDLGNAFTKALEWGDKIPIGTFYKKQMFALHETDPVSRDRIVTKEPLGFAAQDLSAESVFAEFR